MSIHIIFDAFEFYGFYLEYFAKAKKSLNRIKFLKHISSYSINSFSQYLLPALSTFHQCFDSLYLFAQYFE